MGQKTRTIIEMTESQVQLMQTAWRHDEAALAHYLIADIKGLAEDDIAKKLTLLNKENKLNLKLSETIAVIPRSQVILRYFKLPSPDITELRQMVNLQLSSHIPYTLEEVVVDHIVLNTDTQGYSKVLVFVAPREVALRLAKILQAANVALPRMTVSSMGVFHWYQICCTNRTDVSVLLDIGRHSSEICICDFRHLWASRSIPMGIEQVEAKQYEEFLKQIDWTVKNYDKEALGPMVSRLILLSSMEAMGDFHDYLSKGCSIPVDYRCTISRVPVVKTFKWPNVLEANHASMTVSLGLGLGQVSDGIDLLPAEIKKDQYKQKRRFAMMRFSMIAGVTLAALILAFSLNAIYEGFYLKKLQQQLRQAKGAVAMAQKKSDKINALKAVLQGRLVFMNVVDEIYRLMPSEISLVRLMISNGRILTMEGISRDAAGINQLQNGMVNSSKFSNVNLDYVNKRITQEGEVNYFKITCQVN